MSSAEPGIVQVKANQSQRSSIEIPLRALIGHDARFHRVRNNVFVLGYLKTVEERNTSMKVSDLSVSYYNLNALFICKQDIENFLTKNKWGQETLTLQISTL